MNLGRLMRAQEEQQRLEEKLEHEEELSLSNQEQPVLELSPRPQEGQRSPLRLPDNQPAEITHSKDPDIAQVVVPESRTYSRLITSFLLWRKTGVPSRKPWTCSSTYNSEWHVRDHVRLSQSRGVLGTRRNRWGRVRKNKRTWSYKTYIWQLEWVFSLHVVVPGFFRVRRLLCRPSAKLHIVRVRTRTP